MLFSKKKVTKNFNISRENGDQETEEERRDRLKFYSLRTRRKTGKKSLLWLFLLLGLIGALFWYLSQI